VAVLDRLVAERHTAPRFLRCDNGPELTANALRDWCRSPAPGPATSSPDRPGRTLCGVLRRPAARRAAGRGGLQQPAGGPGAGRGLAGRVQHPPTHSALGYLAPTDYAKTWTVNHPALS
jgi:hypothetical protein